MSNAERRALLHREDPIVARVADVYAALPSITGKFELEYEGELRGADSVARELIKAAVANVFGDRFANADMRRVIEWFDLGGSLPVSDMSSSQELLAQARAVQGLVELAAQAGLGAHLSDSHLAAAVDLILEGLYAM